MERRLSGPYADFLSKVRYIMTSGERRTFLETPDSGKDAFIEEFWARRDPTPESARNEYREEYEGRVKRAGELFQGEGRPGWLTDRGRIHILFGPPFERLTYPMDASGYCREVWYYGNFPVLFIDQHCSGQYVLTAVNLEHLQALNIAQGQFQKPAEAQRKPFDFEVGTRKIRASETVYEAAVTLSIPYDRIAFVYRNDRFEADFDVRVELRRSDNELIQETGKTFGLAVEKEELTSSRGKTYRMEIPLILEAGPAALLGEKMSLDIFVRVNAEREEVRKTVEFRLEF
jgi:GWxTD domain-containing protein